MKSSHIAAGLLSCFAAFASAQRYMPVQKDGVWWLQSGKVRKPFFSFGVCVVDTGTKWEDYDPGNPSYAAHSFYPTKPLWATGALQTLKSGGFNTVGAWSEYRPLLDQANNDLFMTPINHMGSSAGFPWLDMWDPALVKVADDVARDQVALLKKDPRIIGYFSDNELGWWKGALFDWVWKQKTLGTRSRVVALFRKRYANSWTAFQREFETTGARNFTELSRTGHAYLRPGGNGIGAVTETLRLLADRYYSLCRSIIKKWDPDALYLGDRYISNYYPEVAQEAGKYCDIVSTNLNPNWTDGGYVRYHLSSLQILSHRPLMVTEYYMCAKENGSGNENNHSGFPVVQTQAQRSLGFAATTISLLKEPSLVGAHWFQYYDEPQKGREDGENYNFGLVDVHNRPYQALLGTGKSLDLTKLHQQATSPRPLIGALPPTPEAWKDLTHWNRPSAFVEPANSVAYGDLYGSWSTDALNLALYWSEERFQDGYFKGGKVPESSLSTFEIDVPSSRLNWKLRVNDKAGEIVAGPKWTFEFKPGTASSLLVRIPAAAFGKRTLSQEDWINLHARLVSRTRAYETNWSLHRRLGMD